MDVRSNNSYWLAKNGRPHKYPTLSEDITTDVVVMGGGITGALTSWHLCKAGFDVTLVDKRPFGNGSTAASTSLLQYEIDTPLRILKNSVGEQNAARSYHLCIKAIKDLKSICQEWKDNCGFQEKPSIQYASFKKDVLPLREEYSLRKKHGIHLQYLSASEIK